jgi:hypothetical protein
MGMSYRRYLAGERIYGCSKCRTHLATIHSMISRVSLFHHSNKSVGIDRGPCHCRLSMANMAELIFLKACECLWLCLRISDVLRFSSVNVLEGDPDDRVMTTGTHTVRDIYCCKCKTILGWKYVRNMVDKLEFQF